MRGRYELGDTCGGRRDGGAVLDTAADFVFVAGSGHCGSSLLAAMLGAHPRIHAIPDETNAFMRELPDAGIRSRLARFVNERDKADIDFVCEKTPRHILKFDKIAELYPSARFIVIVRDPRDVVASFKRRGQTFDAAVQRWRSACNHLGEWQEAGLPVLVVHFERLVGEPAASLTGVCQFLGIPYEPAMLEYWKDERQWYGATETVKPASVTGADHGVYRNWQIHQPLMADTIGTSEGELSQAELDEISRELSLLASAHGYAFAQPPGADRDTEDSVHIARAMG